MSFWGRSRGHKDDALAGPFSMRPHWPGAPSPGGKLRPKGGAVHSLGEVVGSIVHRVGSPWPQPPGLFAKLQVPPLHLQASSPVQVTWGPLAVTAGSHAALRVYSASSGWSWRPSQDSAKARRLWVPSPAPEPRDGSDRAFCHPDAEQSRALAEAPDCRAGQAPPHAAQLGRVLGPQGCASQHTWRSPWCPE